MTKPTPTNTRRTALAIVAASAGVTLAVTATLAGSFGLIAPYPSATTTSDTAQQPVQQAPEPLFMNEPASDPAPAINQPPSAMTVARRDHDDDDDDDQSEQVRRPAPTRASVERSATSLTSRATREERHDDDDDD